MRRSQIHMLGMATLAMTVGLVASGCGLIELLLGNLGTGFQVPSDSVLLEIRNESGLPLSVEANFVFSVQDVRRTTRRLEKEGPESTEQILRTVAQRIEVIARVAADLVAKSPFEEPGYVLLQRTLLEGTDYVGGDTVVIVIVAPPRDCNENGVVDADEIASGDADDCNENAILDACENDADGDGVIDACDNCPDQFNPGQGAEDCPVTQPVPTGACCAEDGSCQVLTPGDCSEAGGSYAGDDVSCNAAECPQPTGACCFIDGSCSELTLAACEADDGTYQGNGSNCDSADCPQPQGACCFGDGSCSVLTQASCHSFEGTYQGNNTSCTQVACTQPAATGACCLGDNECFELTSDACDSFEGVYLGDDTVCDSAACAPPTGACCSFDGQCAEVTEVQCFQSEGEYQGNFTTCIDTSCPQPSGACCFLDGSCSELTEADCGLFEGTFQGNFTLCQFTECPQPIGACCLGGECTIVTEAECTDFEGEYLGDNSHCDNNPCVPLVACCFIGKGEDFCQDLTEADCDDFGGFSLGAGSVCAPGVCDSQISASMTSSREWVYEALDPGLFEPGAVAPRTSLCQVFFTASIDGDPRPNTSHSYFWWIEAPFDQPGGAFVPVFGQDSEIEAFAPPTRPAYSPSSTPYIVHVTIVGDQFGNFGTASVPIEVRLHGDVDNDGCTTELDVQQVIAAEDNPPEDPELFYILDLTCDFDITALDAQSANYVANNFDGHGNCTGD